jgi:hypothetical protein
MGSTQQLGVLFSSFPASSRGTPRMQKWLIALAASALVTTAWADGGARAAAVNPAAGAAHSAAAAPGKTSKKADSAKSATRHRKKARKSAMHLGLKAHAVK